MLYETRLSYINFLCMYNLDGKSWGIAYLQHVQNVSSHIGINPMMPAILCWCMDCFIQIKEAPLSHQCPIYTINLIKSVFLRQYSQLHHSLFALIEVVHFVTIDDVMQTLPNLHNKSYHYSSSWMADRDKVWVDEEENTGSLRGDVGMMASFMQTDRTLAKDNMMR